VRKAVKLMDTLQAYRLKEEYRHLFTNLGTGGMFQLGDAFAPPPDVPFQRGDAAKNAQRLKVLEALVKAGFLETVDMGLTAKKK
jgi:hypothetical protein